MKKQLKYCKLLQTQLQIYQFYEKPFNTDCISYHD